MDDKVYRALAERLMQGVGAGPMVAETEYLLDLIAKGDPLPADAEPPAEQGHLWLIAALHARAAREILELREVQDHLARVLQARMLAKGHRSFRVSGLIRGGFTDEGQFLVESEAN